MHTASAPPKPSLNTGRWQDPGAEGQVLRSSSRGRTRRETQPPADLPNGESKWNRKAWELRQSRRRVEEARG